MRLKHAIVGLAAALGCAFGVAAYAGTGSNSAKPPIHFALVSYAVPGSDSLTELTAGARGAAKQINARGGFGGRKVVIDACNSLFSPATSTVCAHKLLAKHPVAEFGCELTWSASGLPIFAKAKIPSVNCPDTAADFNHPWSFGLNTSAIGQQVGAARYLCSRSDVHTVVSVMPDLPSLKISQQSSYQVAQRCGKQTADPVFYPLTAADVTPYVNKVVQEKPDFVLFSGIGGQAVLFFKTFQQNGIPPSHVAAPDIDFVYSTTLKQAGGAMDGAYAENQFHTWGDAKNPEVAAYLKAFKGSSVDPRDPTVAWGYSDVMFFYEAAKKIGFAKFNSASLTKFLRTAKGFHIPMSRSLFIPGPKGFPQERQPYLQISQWKNGKMSVVRTGPKKDGWVYGYPR